MTDPVLSQLVSVESDLAEQIEQIETQLSQLQTKRQGLLTVIDLFGEGGKKQSVAASKPAAATRTKKVAKKAPAKGTSRKTTQAKRTKTTRATATASKTKTKAKPGRKKKDGRAAKWQRHVQTQYRDLALPESVSSVLRSQPSEIFTIAEVMSSIFKESMPRTDYLKARNRISNILSAGARDGTWYKGRNGRYSLSENVKKV